MTFLHIIQYQILEFYIIMQYIYIILFIHNTKFLYYIIYNIKIKIYFYYETCLDLRTIQIKYYKVQARLIHESSLAHLSSIYLKSNLIKPFANESQVAHE